MSSKSQILAEVNAKVLKSLSHLAYSPKFLGAESVKMNPLEVFTGMIKDHKVWQLGISLDGGNSQNITYKGMVENLYKSVLVEKTSPDGIKLQPQVELHKVHCAITSKSTGMGLAPKYHFNLWSVDNEGNTVEDHSIDMSELVSVYLTSTEATADKVTLTFNRYIGDTFKVVLVGGVSQ